MMNRLFFPTATLLILFLATINAANQQSDISLEDYLNVHTQDNIDRLEDILHTLFHNESGYLVSHLPASPPIKGKIKITSSKPNHSAIWNLPSLSSTSNSKKISYRYTGNAITQGFNGGRLGDCLLSYLHAKWLAYKYDLPFYYRPFIFSDKFCLSDLEQSINPLDNSSNYINLNNENKINTYSNRLLEIPYFPESLFEFKQGQFQKSIARFEVDWDDPEFRIIISKCLALKTPVKGVDLPKESINIGVHVRRGGKQDTAKTRKNFPLKFPSDEYYIEQLSRISKIFPDEPLNVYILTDDANPTSIAQKYARAINHPNMHFNSSPNNHNYKSNELEDFVLIQKFDCLILCQSNFSVVSSKLGNYKLTFSPVHAKVSRSKKVIIDEVEITFDTTN